MSETVEQVAARLGITPAELERRIDEARAAIRGKTAVPDLPPGYESGASVLRLPDAHAMKIDPRALWVKPGEKGRPAVESPLEKAITAEERRRFDVTGNSLRAQSARRAADAATAIHRAKGDKTRAAVEDAVAEGARKHTIPGRVKKSPRRVNQILAASEKKKSP
ncbi:MAG: hypothetical protein KKA22_12975 [Gammaproteobacteria bacterium]|nr:hypothetical protein [Gammaproteobacteria bacterium]MBU1409049.1 hypothetical protein [Gammaproteobacteria bacterium]MBU1533530.1 hypothetical protein [Gammaproteobacteria bacterium]